MKKRTEERKSEHPVYEQDLNNDEKTRLRKRFREYMLSKYTGPTAMEEGTGIPKSTIGSVLDDKKANAPSSSFILKVKNADPEFNLNWFFTGNGPMFIKEENNVVNESAVSYLTQSPIAELVKIHKELIQKIDQKLTISMSDKSDSKN